VSRFQTYEAFVIPPAFWSLHEKTAREILREVRSKYPYARSLFDAVSSYEAAATSLAPVSAAAYVNIWAPTRPLEITHVAVWQTTTTALGHLQAIRSTARGTQSTTVTPTAAANATNPGFMLAPTFVIDTAWSVQPTVAAIPMRDVDIAGTQGSNVFWDWGDQDPLQVVNGNGLAIWNALGSTTAIARAQVRARE